MKTHEQYEHELFVKEIDFLPLETYKLANSKILHECINGHQFYESPSNILRGRGCLLCSGRSSTKRKDTQDHISDLNEKNKNFILKSDQVYINNKTPLVYICSNGHEKSFKPTEVLKGYGCIDCVPRGRYTDTYFKRNQEEATNSGIIYLVRLEDRGDIFVKIGITSGHSASDLKKRIIKYSSFSPVVLAAFTTTLKKAFDIEQQLIQTYSRFKYVSKTKFAGHTELFSTGALEFLRNELYNLHTEEVTV